MRLIILAGMAAVGVSVAANAQLNIATSNKDPLTGLEGAQWAQLATRVVNGKSVAEKLEVFAVNATGEELISVSCDKWSLVGANPYIKGNPASLPAWQVTLVHTEGFDGYCKNGLTAMSAVGGVYAGALNAPDYSFANSTFVVFRLPRQ